MIIKVFTLGRPGSGKSTAAEQLAKVAWNRGLSVRHIDDYRILLEMAQWDTAHAQFRPTVYGGFDVLDFSVLDEALKQVRREVLEVYEERASKDIQLVTIEFARDNYQAALKLFDDGFLRDNTYFIFVEADLNRCIERVSARNFSLQQPDEQDGTEHYVSEYILRSYYARDDVGDALRRYLAGRGVHPNKVKLIANRGSAQCFRSEVARVIDEIFDGIPQVASAAPRLAPTG